MKNKTKFLLTSLFILVAFLLLGTTNVNAATVTTEEQLRAAVSGSDSSITEVKLGANIELTGNLGIFPVNDLILDLNGNTIDGHTNEKYIYIKYGENELTSGSLTIKDSGESAGSIKSYQTIGVGNDNNDTSTEKTYGLTIENGQFYIRGSMWSDHVFNLTYSLANKNVTFNFQVKDGYFEKGYNAGGVLSLAEEFTNDNINLNIKLDKLTLYSTSQLDSKLIYSYSDNVTLKLSDVISAGSKVVLKKTGSETTGTVTDLDVSAISAEPLNSVLSNYNTIEVIKTEGFDVENVTLNETYGYTTATSVVIPIKNRGTNPLKIKNVSVDSSNFIVDGNPTLVEPPTVAAGATDNTTATIKAKPGLNAGTYTATITVTDENDKTYTSTVTLIVAKKRTTGVSIDMQSFMYGETPSTLDVDYGDLKTGQYIIEYSVKNANDWKTTAPTKAGLYTVKLSITDENLLWQSWTADYEIKKNNIEIQIIANSHEWTYDSHIQMDEGYTVKYNGEVAPGGVLPTGDIVTAVIIGSVKDVKDTVIGNNVVNSYTITDSSGVDSKDCYLTKTKTNGTLTINPITTPIIVTADSANKAYDGIALTKDSYTFTNGIVKIGDKLTATITGSQTYVGTSSNTVSNVKVMRGSADISENYTFGTHVNGTLTVTAVNQPLSIADQYVTVGGTLLTSELEAALTGAEGNVSFEVTSGTAGVYDDSLYGGFKAGNSVGDVTMTVTSTARDLGGSEEAEYSLTTKTFVIHVVNKETVTISGITNNQEFTYDGGTHTPTGTITVTDNKVPVSDLEVSYEGVNLIYNSTTAPKNAGIYKVKYKVPNSNANYVGEATFNFTIKRAQLPKVTLKQNSYFYTGEVINAEFNNYDADKIILSGDLSAKNVNSVNTYIISVSLKDPSNYIWDGAGTTALMLYWNITKADPSYEELVPTNLTGLRGQTLNDITLPSGFTWNNSTLPLIVGTKTYKATYTPSDTDNYNIMNNIDITIVTKDIFNVTTSVVGGNGTISTSYSNVVEGSTKEITFTPDEGFMIDKVLVNDVKTSVTGNKLTLTVNEDKEVKVSYKKIPFTITVVDTEGATITPNGVVIVNYGDDKEFTIYANYGYRFIKVLVNDVDKTDKMVGDILTLNNITANMEIEVVVERIDYEVIEGANQEYTITKDTEAKFRIDAEYGLFMQGGKVYVDDELVDEENYTSKEGSTIITLKQAYVDTLAVGKHTLKVTFADGGVATANFTVAKVAQRPTEGSNPKTFDNIMIYIAIAIMSVVGLGATVVIKKKKAK